MSRLRKGFTLIELLVVMAIIGILVSLLVPAVQKVRAAAAATQCTNNLKQIALGTLNHHETFGFFPQGGGDPGSTISPPSGDNPAKRLQWFSWTYHILPYIEQVNVHRLIPTVTLQQDITTVAGGSAALSKLDQSLIPIYYCPARRPVQGFHTVDSICDYAANTGSNGTDGAIIANNGTAYYKVKITRDITDGASNTMLIGERRVNLASLDSGLDCYDNEACFRPGSDGDVLRRGAVGPELDMNDINLATSISCGYFGGNGILQFGSSHHGSMIAALCDGSVRRVNYMVDPTVFKNFCMRADGKPFSVNQLD